MKRITYLSAVTLQLFSVIAGVCVFLAIATSCNDIEPQKAERNCTITLSVTGDLPTDENEETKAYDPNTGANLEDEEWDSKVTSVQYFIYRQGDGSTYTFYGKENETSNHKISHNCEPGDYKIYAVINGETLESPTVAELEGHVIGLGANTRTKGFVMFGSNTVKITAGNEVCEIAVRRHLARVNLVSIKNNTEDKIPVTFKCAFLSNVVANQKFDGTAGISTWDNLAGRKGSNYVSASNVDDAEMTLYAPASSIEIASGETHNFGEKVYGYPNPTTTDSFGGAVTSGKTRLVVVCELTSNGTTKDYYYPVTLANGFERSTTYDVKLSILGIGSDDPNILVNKVGMTFTIDPWVDGNTYSEEY